MIHLMMAWDGNVLSHGTDLHVENMTKEQSYEYRQWRLVKSNVRQDVFSCHITGK